MDTNFTIEAAPPPDLTLLPVLGQGEEFFGPGGDPEVGARVVTLAKALELAVHHNRSYQARKELVYLEALALTLDRHRFTPIFSAGTRAVYRSVRDVETGIDEVIEERSVVVTPAARMDVLLRSGGRVAVSFATDFLRFLTGDPRWTTSSALVGSLSQPLLRGAGFKVAMETLTQAERNLLYRLREFTFFRKDFSVDIASLYYDVLRNRDTVRNSWRSLESFRLNVQRSRALAEEGRLAQSDLDRLLQAELTTETSWINALRAYRQSLDRFKIELGLATDANLVLDDGALERLAIDHPQLTAEEAVEVALVTRLDLDVQRDQLEDAQRQIDVAANGLLPDLDVVADAAVPSKIGNDFPSPDFRRYSWSAGLELDLPLDRKAERNIYRRALISYERAQRELALAVDTIKLQINDDWRALDQAKRNYENAEIGVRLSEGRVEEQQLRAELGLGKALDLVDAQNALLNAKNERTDALVNHTIARLRFWRDMGILAIQPDGQWATPTLPSAP